MNPMPTDPSPSPITQLSALDQAEFVARLGGIFEHSPWVAERSWAARPFASVDTLHAAMVATMRRASRDEQLALIRAHPELAGKEAEAGTLTRESTGEQKGAGLDQCSQAELERLRTLNAAYRTRFGFPFVIAVKGLTRYQIMEAVERRLSHDAETEFETCLNEITRITRARLDAQFG